MKNISIKSFFYSVIILSFLCRENYAQMPPHPSLLEKIKRGEQQVPYALSNLNLIRNEGVDAPWSSPKLNTLNKQSIFSRSFGPAGMQSGNWKALAVLVQFSDKPSQVNGVYFDSLLFGQRTGTLHDYYEKVSYGNLDIVTVNLPGTIGWITAPQTYSYYVNGKNGLGNYPQNSRKLVEDAVSSVNPQIDFSEYDNDGDGYVDALFIIHSGRGAEYTGNDNDLWSHSWTTSTPQYIDGVNVYRYSVLPEYWLNPGDMTCGVFAHEMGHAVYGLPDLYDTDLSSSGLGNWSLMAAGSWNGILGNSPSFPDAWSHIQMGYLIPTLISANILGQTINDVENTPEIYLLWNDLCGSEYFLVENRQQIGYDAYLPGNGLCIYHIDNSMGNSSDNKNNSKEWYPGHTSSGHYHVALEQADGLWNLEHKNNYGDSGDPYPGVMNARNFSSLTVPDSRDYSLNEISIKITDISLSSPVMTANLNAKPQAPLQQFTEQGHISLYGVQYSSVSWGDYDNDGDLDILLDGNCPCCGGAASKIYRNNGFNTFTEQTSISLSGTAHGSAAWGDYDNDGYLDILLTGDFSSKIYRNNGNNTFTEQTSISLAGISFGNGAWGDYDNDGDLDILLTGLKINDVDPLFVSISKIYRNNGNNSFTEQTSISLTGVSYSTSAWGDYDNDSDQDILLTGVNMSDGSIVSKIYRNNGNNWFTEQKSISLVGVLDGSASWEDYDGDGYIDILLIGTDPSSDQCVSKIYRNNGNNAFSEETSINLVGLLGSAAWGDYDNDGYLDILLTGQPSYGANFSRIYHNNRNNSFTESSISLSNMRYSSAAWGDYDNDGDLDMLIAGREGDNSLSKIYKNNILTPNIPPAVPANLQIEVNGNYVTFTWDKSTDNETPQNGLTYNLVIGTSPGASDILSPMSDINSGKRRIVSTGNAGHCNYWTIKRIPNGEYYWSVQAIDNCFAGSDFAAFQSFVIQTEPAIIVTSPAGIEKWGVGTNPVITYNSVGNSGYLDLDYSTDGGSTWNIIAANQLDDGDYRGWIVPNTPSKNCKIRITDSDGNPSATSNGLFTIQSPGTIIITSPGGGEEWEAGSNPVITYSSLGNSGYVNLDYSLDGGVAWDTIATHQLDDGNYQGWIVPNTPSTKCKIRITDTDGSPSAISDSSFTILGDIPVELVSFNAGADKNKIILKWKTATEINNKGFEIERTPHSPPFGKGGKQGGWEKIGFVNGAGTSVNENDYFYSDNSLTVSGSYSYRLKQIDYDGTFNYSDEVLIEANLIPDKLTLSQNYPNPFNPSTTIRYGIPTDGDVKLVVYGVLGNEAAVLVNEKKEAGSYEVVFDGSGLANGIYIYRLQAGNTVQTKKMVLLK